MKNKNKKVKLSLKKVSGGGSAKPVATVVEANEVVNDEVFSKIDLGTKKLGFNWAGNVNILTIDDVSIKGQ